MIRIKEQIIASLKNRTLIIFENREEYDKWNKTLECTKGTMCLYGGAKTLVDHIIEGDEAQEKLEKFEEQFGTFEENF